VKNWLEYLCEVLDSEDPSIKIWASSLAQCKTLFIRLNTFSGVLLLVLGSRFKLACLVNRIRPHAASSVRFARAVASCFDRWQS
jgi:hypothetical protein